MVDCCLCGFEQADILLKDGDMICSSCLEGYDLFNLLPSLSFEQELLIIEEDRDK